MVLCKDSYQRGYNDAFKEMYRSINSKEHDDCDSCRACGVVSEVTEHLVQQLSAWMTEDELEEFTDIVVRVGERRRIAKMTGKGPQPVGWVFFM